MSLEKEAKEFMEQKKTPEKEGLDRQAVRFYLAQVVSASIAAKVNLTNAEVTDRVLRLIEMENELVRGPR